ncbi:MAG: 23S rRNA (uracil(1939)-C(5))-methyltransferase RlmD [Chloroflexi bacterium]|nr:23S rRNA (uracil(1939)-C(5))-methyltransferase RlmD [Chloroflexota bacterium]
METITLSLTDMAYGGDAIGRHEGQAVFVPLGIPGETVRVAVEARHRSFLRGRLLEVLQPSPERVLPPCPYFRRCGGCQWQHMSYRAQLHWKREIVRAQLRRIGRQEEPLVRPMLGMVTPWSYRNHVQLRPALGGGLGYYALHSHQVVPVERCLLVDPLLDELWHISEARLPGVQTVSLRAGVATGEKMILLEGAELQPPRLKGDLPFSCLYLAPDGQLHLLSGRAALQERLLGRTFRVSATSFFQVNSSQAERLIEVARRYVEPKEEETLLDIYCGVGTFAISLAEEVHRVVGVESSSEAVADALANAQANGVAGRCCFVAGDAARVLSKLDEEVQAILLDPPRAGCQPEVLAKIAQSFGQKQKSRPSRIVYVSCDPATLARDILRLNELGYRLIEVQPVDMFPQTYHIECVALLSACANAA